MSTSTERIDSTLHLMGAQLVALSRSRTRKELQEQTGLSRPTLIAAEKGEDVQLSTLLRILEAHGKLPSFETFLTSLCT